MANGAYLCAHPGQKDRDLADGQVPRAPDEREGDAVPAYHQASNCSPKVSSSSSSPSPMVPAAAAASFQSA